MYYLLIPAVFFFLVILFFYLKKVKSIQKEKEEIENLKNKYTYSGRNFWQRMAVEQYIDKHIDKE